MIEPLKLYQKYLHHSKIARLDKHDDEFEFIVYRLFEELNDKMTEVIQEQNRAESRRVISGPASAFFDEGDNVYMAYPGEELDPTDPDTFDVVILPDLFPFKDNYFYTLQESERRAIKRVVFGWYGASPQETTRLERFMNAQNWYWVHDEAEKPTYIIEKAETTGQRLLLPRR